MNASASFICFTILENPGSSVGVPAEARIDSN